MRQARIGGPFDVWDEWRNTWDGVSEKSNVKVVSNRYPIGDAPSKPMLLTFFHIWIT
jgi:hypothetical protein